MSFVRGGTGVKLETAASHFKYFFQSVLLLLNSFECSRKKLVSLTM